MLAHYDHHSHKNDDHQSHLGCTGPLSTEPGTGVADKGGELFVEGEAGHQAQHLHHQHGEDHDYHCHRDHENHLDIKYEYQRDQPSKENIAVDDQTEPLKMQLR